MSKANEINNLLRSINSYADLQVAIDTLESVVYNFEQDDVWLRDIAPTDVRDYEKATINLNCFITNKRNQGEL